MRDVGNALEHCVPFVALGEIQSADKGSRQSTRCNLLLGFLYTQH